MAKNSELWNFFEKSNAGNKVATCNYCRRELSYKTTTTNLKCHLKQKHISAYHNLLKSGKSLESTAALPTVSQPVPGSRDVEIVAGGGQARGDTAAVGSVGGGSGTLKQLGQNNNVNVIEPPTKVQRIMHAPIKIEPDEKKKIDLCLLKMIVYDFQPFSIVEDEGFRTYTHALNPNYEIPDRKTLSTNLLTKEYQKRLEQLKSCVKSYATSVCITVDCWTSRTMDSYMGITAHFIVDDKIKSILIQCAEFEGDDRLNTEIKSTLLGWNIYNKVNFFVSDNASNMESAARYFEAEGWTHFGCLAHKLNLVVQDALNEIKDVLLKVQKIVNHFRKSTIAKEKLIQYQLKQQNTEQPKTVIKSVPTRWNSVYLMLQRFIYLKEAIRGTVPKLDAVLPILPNEEWKCIQQICVVLKPFYEATVEMSAENYLGASKAIILTSSLTSICHNYCQIPDLLPPVMALAKKLESGMTKRLGNIEKNEKIALSALLDPRFKLKAFKQEENKNNIKKSLLEKMVDLISIEPESQNSEPIPSTPAASNAPAPLQVNTEVMPSFSLWNDFDLEVNVDDTPKTNDEKASEEFERYLSECLIKRTQCPFKWWREHKYIYPTLFKLFRQHCNIMVTSAPCERMFSKSGYVISDRRTRLSTTKVAQMMFLNVNKI